MLSISASAEDFLTTKTRADRQCIYLFLSSISSLWSDTCLMITLSMYIHTNHICFKTNSKTWKVTSIRSEVFFFTQGLNISVKKFFFSLFCREVTFYLSLLMVCQLLSATFLVVCEINISVSLSMNKSNKDDFIHYHMLGLTCLVWMFYSTCNNPKFYFIFHNFLLLS